jgi:hypothetical protein
VGLYEHLVLARPSGFMTDAEATKEAPAVREGCATEAPRAVAPLEITNGDIKEDLDQKLPALEPRDRVDPVPP